MIDIETCRAVRRFIRDNWQNTVMRDDGSKKHSLGLPQPYLVPCIPGQGQFTCFFYWDTFFALVGVALDGQRRLVRDCAENFMHEAETLGFIPNFSKTICRRSQPPVATQVYRLAYDMTGDRVLLRRAIDAAIAEHAFWMSQRSTPTGLNVYGHDEAPPQVANTYWSFRDRCPQMPEPVSQRRTFLSHKLAEAESGWDFTPRFRDRCMHVLPCDLNALLYATERDIADFMAELGDRNEVVWRERAEARRQMINELLWDPSSGCYHDYDLQRGERIPMISGAASFCLWCGVPDAAQAERLLQSLAALETEHGLTCVTEACSERVPNVCYQWDHPNGWAPLHYAMIAGCRRYGFAETASRIAGKWVATVNRNFTATGHLWGKYNMVTGDIETADEYDMPPMLGWTAGVYVTALEALGLLQDTRASDQTPAATPPSADPWNQEAAGAAS